jgi:hypothetical protein
VGIAAAGSFLTNSMDEFSDLDIIVVTEPSDHSRVMSDRERIAGSLGPLLTAFTGEHVGEPRLLICLYDTAPPLHVDLKFVALSDLPKRIEDPAVLWERGGRLRETLEQGTADYPAPDNQWIEDRFWVWIHYAATKVGRGELLEVVDFLSFLRMTALGPLALVSSGARPAGVRNVERLAPQYLARLRATVAAHDSVDCVRALRASVELYRSLRFDGPAIQLRADAERVAMQYLFEVGDLVRSRPGAARGVEPEAVM